ncbi:tetratricopeptide repeat protein [Methylovulum psychrotolerans]|uniref:Uncharacterized protein n=1 Tax=Methylovulum psychrotolerans TaxID=1704499 RepID=A0A1Z4C1W8_9GAMM|nr:tetratricopeptide repeat protein [Methylovulum psychrotolerans]ASF47495.1 hypothetical protein CEK71_16295 [Methylovulum psychrotolerans]
MNDKYQDFLNKLQNASESERDWVVMEFSLQNLSEIVRQAVWAAAIPHWFDQQFLTAVLAHPLKDSDFNALTALSFIEVYPERGFNVHERSRKLLLDKLWSSKKARYQKLSKQAAAYCKTQNQNDPVWRVEMLYHGLLANNLTAKKNFVEQATDWHDSFQFDSLEHLTQVVLEAVDSGKLTGEVAALTAYWQAKLDILYNRFSSAQVLLQQALKQRTNNIVMAHCMFVLGEVHYYLSEYDQALDCYQKALSIFRQTKNGLSETNCIKAIGDVYFILNEHAQAMSHYQQTLPVYQKTGRRLGEANCIQAISKVHYALAEYEQAMGRYRQALLIYQEIKERLGEAGCILGLGDLYCALAKYDQAETDFNQALEIYQQAKSHLGAANCLRALGRLYGLQKRTISAITILQQAAQLFESIGDCRSKAGFFFYLAELYRHQKQFTQALEACNQAIDLFPNQVEWYQDRAKLYMKMEDYSAALADIIHAEALGKNTAYTLYRKAELALWQQQTPQAVELCQQALAYRPADGDFRAFLALTLLADGQTEAANTLMKQALTAIYHPQDFEDLLDVVDKLIRIYGERTDFTLMREILAEKVTVEASSG